MPTLKELSVIYAKKQPNQVDQITEDAPILAMLPFKASTHPMWNVYEELTGVTGAGFVDLDASLPTVGADSELRQIDLAVMGGQIEVGEDKAKLFGGRDKYFASQMPAINRKTGMSTEYAILYNNLRKFAVDNGLIYGAGGTGGKNYSMLIVRLDDMENTGLYSPDGFSNGTMLDAAPINGGNLYLNNEVNPKLVYGMRLKGYFGWQIASKMCVRAIVNITAAKLPTANQIADALSDVRYNSRTFIMCHPRLLQYLGAKFKTDIVQMTTSDNGINNIITSWNGVQFKTSYNFLDGKEADVTIQ